MNNNNNGGRVPLYNWIGLLGLGLGLIGFVTGVTLFLIDLTGKESPPYVAIPYALSLMFFMGGLALVLIGRYVERRRRAQGKPFSRLSLLYRQLYHSSPYVAALLLITGVGLASTLVGVGSYKAFQTTQSNAFCGGVCHSVMSPEYTAYHTSSHARVDCVQCHVGSGVGYYLRSKVSGLNQVAAIVSGDVPRPIPTPIKHMRPARDTCEQCHWPSRFIGYKEVIRTYHLADEENTAIRLRLLLKIGGKRSGTSMGWGIHYHMLAANQVSFIARDPRKQKIALVHVERADGSSVDYENTDEPLSDEERKSLPVHVMDCIDCHNRPAHQFQAPVNTVNDALEDGLISMKLPYAKLQAVTALSAEYDTTEGAMTKIAQSLREYYKAEYPEVLDTQEAELAQAIDTVQSIFRRSIFPEMKANWLAYPDNIGHRDSPGCFRCHNDLMESKAGDTIFTNCQKCHLFLAQGDDVDNVTVDYRKGAPFVHPDDGEVIDEATECVECHNGGAYLYE